MRFYRFKYPEYETDMEYSRKNPVEWVSQFIIPSVTCPDCGTWFGNRRLFLPVEDEAIKKLLKRPPYPLPLEEWRSLTNRVSLAMTSGYDPQPGDELGGPTVKITSAKVSDFIFPWRGGILVTEKARDAIIKSELMGCQFLKVELIDKRSKKSRENPLPSLYVLLVTGRIISPIKFDCCPICGKCKGVYLMELCEENWDGNDFILDENYPNLVFVTERACAVIKQSGLTNYQCSPIKGEE